MARILNLLIVIMEIVTLTRDHKRGNLKKGFIYYTQISNVLTLITSLLLVVAGQRSWVEVGRYLSVSMLVLTFLVTAFVLVPMTKNAKGLLFSGIGLFHHLIIPIVSTVSYLFAEDKASFSWILLPAAVTLIYGLVMIYLNVIGKVDGPYPFLQVKKLGARISAIWMAVLLIVMSLISGAVGYQKPAQTDMKYVFVHGLSGWGSYDFMNEFLPYWGLTSGSITRYLNKQGYESYAASVDPNTSAWDRACELYAQLTGTQVDYGEAHSKEAGHERFGEDFTGRALLEDFESSRVSLIGHSFGGATIRLFSEILKNGSQEERNLTAEDDLSDFFKGGNGDNLFALVTLAAPSNGTTAYDLYEDENFDLSSVEIPEKYQKDGGKDSDESKSVDAAKESQTESDAEERKSDIDAEDSRVDGDGRKEFDYAAYDMHIDNALELNERIDTFDDLYYISYPTASTMTDENGRVVPDPSITESSSILGSYYMGSYTGVTKGGFTIDESWQANDGLVNEISSRAPLGAPQVEYDGSGELEKGQWYVMPTFKGDHMSVIGGFMKRRNVKPFYLELVRLLAAQN